MDGLLNSIFSIESEVLDHWLQFGEERVDFIISLALAGSVEIEIFISNMRKIISLDMGLISFSDHLLFFLVLGHKVDTDDSSPVIIHVFEMLEESWVGKIVASSDLSCSGDTSLLPEKGNTTSDLEMGATVTVVIDDLLRFDEVGWVAIVIDTSGIETGTCFETTSSGN